MRRLLLEFVKEVLPTVPESSRDRIDSILKPIPRLAVLNGLSMLHRPRLANGSGLVYRKSNLFRSRSMVVQDLPAFGSMLKKQGK
jgi:hypothetical protein